MFLPRKHLHRRQSPLAHVLNIQVFPLVRRRPDQVSLAKEQVSLEKEQVSLAKEQVSLAKEHLSQGLQMIKWRRL